MASDFEPSATGPKPWSLTVSPARALQGSCVVAPDKSLTHRAIMLSSLAEGSSSIRHPLFAEDCERTLSAFKAMGIAIQRSANELTIHGQGLHGLKTSPHPIDCGNSGTTMRLLAGILAAQPMRSTLVGDASLSRRPMDRIIEPLTRMGAKILAQDKGYPPLEITGCRPLAPLRWRTPIPSAQVKSSILLAGLFADGETSMEEPVLSRDHTERMLPQFGVPIGRRGHAVSVRGPARLTPATVEIPGDLSSAAFFLVAACLLPGSELRVTGVGVNPTRTGVLEVLRMMGARVHLEGVRTLGGEPTCDIVVRAAPLRGTIIQGSLIPRLIDEIPVLAVAATQAEGTTEIRDAAELRVKESDRIGLLAEELDRLGARITPRSDGLLIHGPTRLRGGEVQSHGDHRLAMSLAVAGLLAEGEVRIHDVTCVDTSFPGFWQLLEQLVVR
ncbi:MAG: 3-phosphoshikimate 1-carboxyvinyltransferase [Elusimicrobia bacterium]|nr:3-phosphoshikimate 1-carboxyvinyltransferase [Elusimicrobiota bacterium]